MKLVITAVRDSVTEAFEPPMFWLTTGQALRSFGDAVNQPSKDGVPQPYVDHPEHFTLFALGQFDQGTGVLTVLEQPVELAKAMNLKTGA